MNIQAIIDQFDSLTNFLSVQEQYTLSELYTIVTEAFGFNLKKGKSHTNAEREQIIDFVQDQINLSEASDNLDADGWDLDGWRLTGDSALPVFYWTRSSIIDFISLILEQQMILEANEVIEEDDDFIERGCVDINTASALAGKSSRTIRSWIKNGYIEAKKEDENNKRSRWLINRKSLFDYLGDSVMLNPLDLYPVEEERHPFFDHVDLEYNSDCEYNTVDVGLTFPA